MNKIITYERFDPKSTINQETHPHLSSVEKIWKITFEDGTEYSVMEDRPRNDKFRWLRHLRIIRSDGFPIHNWKHMQEIKNQLWSPNTVAVEIFPSQDELKDGSNCYHLWTWHGINMPNLLELYKYI